MKYSAVLSLAAAPLAMAKVLQNDYNLRQRSNHLVHAAPEPAPVHPAPAPVEPAPVVGEHQVIDENIHVPPAAGGWGGHISTGSTQVVVIWANPGAGAETSTINEKVTVTQTVTEGIAHETGTPVAGGGGAAIATHEVTVGGNAGLVFTPQEITAAQGDMIVFTFESDNHTATQSGFDTPCDKMAGGMNTGFQPNPDNSVNPPPQVAMQVMTTEPLWFYCAQEGHCGQGMVFSVNPTAESTHQQFQANAIASSGEGEQAPITGGGGAAAPPPNGTVGEAPAGSSSVPVPSGTPVAGGGAVEPGQGQVEGGACNCAVQCSTSNFPVGAQGVGAFGGFPGGLPANMAVTN